MSEQRNIEIAKVWLESFNTRNLDRLVDLYDEDCVHVSPKLKVAKPETKGIVAGNKNLREWFAGSFAKYAKLEYIERSLTANSERVWMEYLRRTPGEPDIMVAEILEIDGVKQKITRSRVYHGEQF